MNTQKCPPDPQLQDYHQDKLSGSERKRVAAHVEGCRMCASALQDIALGEEFGRVLREARRSVPVGKREELVASARAMIRKLKRQELDA